MTAAAPQSCSMMLNSTRRFASRPLAVSKLSAVGSIGFADPEAKLAFGYTMNQMGLGLLLNDRGQNLVDATYKALGYRSNASGVWSM